MFKVCWHWEGIVHILFPILTRHQASILKEPLATDTMTLRITYIASSFGLSLNVKSVLTAFVTSLVQDEMPKFAVYVSHYKWNYSIDYIRCYKTHVCWSEAEVYGSIVDCTKIVRTFWIYLLFALWVYLVCRARDERTCSESTNTVCVNSTHSLFSMSNTFKG